MSKHELRARIDELNIVKVTLVLDDEDIKWINRKIWQYEKRLNQLTIWDNPKLDKDK